MGLGETRQPPATATVTPSVTPEATVLVADATTPDGEAGGGRSAWPLWAGGGATLGLAALGLIVVRRPGPCLTGQLTPMATPAGSALVLPRDLGLERRRQVTLGRRGEHAWRLDGWDGAVTPDRGKQPRRGHQPGGRRCDFERAAAPPSHTAGGWRLDRLR